MLKDGRVATRLPAQDLERAPTYYSEKLGLEPVEVRAGGLRTVDGIADIDGNYPSKGIAERGAWFRDSEGDLLGIGQPLRG